MLSKKRIRNKQGSYIVEASICLPLFIVAVLALSLIVNIIAVCESISFATVKEIKNIDLNAYSLKSGGLVERVIAEKNIANCSEKLNDFRLTEFKYLYRDDGIDDLIALESRANFRVLNPIGIGGEITFTEGILTRGFTGKLQDSKPLTAREFEESAQSTIIVIFPKYGERYHIPNCRYVKQNYAGESYHIEMEKEDAKRKGYTPCEICLGGEYAAKNYS